MDDADVEDLAQIMDCFFLHQVLSSPPGSKIQIPKGIGPDSYSNEKNVDKWKRKCLSKKEKLTPIKSTL